MIRHCKLCDQEYLAENRYLRRGQGLFCSMNCSAKYNASKRPKAEPNCVCALCGKNFYKSTSKQGASKSGLFFCCRSHKDLAQRIGGIEEIQPPHYNNGESNYRTIAFRSYPSHCNRCAWDKHPEILVVHHQDLDRSNNMVSNLEILCPNCHEAHHFLTSTGKWGRANRTHQ